MIPRGKFAKLRLISCTFWHRVKEFGLQNVPIYTRHLWILLIQSQTKLGPTFCDFQVLEVGFTLHP